jgi:hypothetical protein
MKTQALGWLMAAVLAAGLNASYHDGGLEWAHRVADRVEHSSAAVLALASGHAGQFLAEARLVSEQMIAEQRIAEPTETPSCHWATAIARAQAKMARAQNRVAHFEAMSDREQAHWDRMEANRERFEARIEAQTAHLQERIAGFNPVVLKTIEIPTHCQRIRINVPQTPTIHIPAPAIDVNVSTDPI